MSVNKSLPHVLVLPEDDANRQIAVGFHLEVVPTRQRRMQVLEEARGWRSVLDRFISDQITGMERYPNRFIILLLDFDNDYANRFAQAKGAIPDHLAERVFILGALSEPEDLRPQFGNFETIGRALAEDCREGTESTWGCDDLSHNAREINRLRDGVRSILF